MGFEEWWAEHSIEKNPDVVGAMKLAFKEIAKQGWDAAKAENEDCFRDDNEN